MKSNEISLAEIDDQIVNLLESIADDLHPECGGGAFGPSAYNTAWVAMVRDPANPDKLAFPLCLEGLFDLQCADGSFGAPYPYTIVPTLAALLCLKKAPVQDQRTQDAAERARIYLERVFPEWDVAHHETVAFEVLVPMLLRELSKLGIELAFPQKSAVLEQYDKKMSLFKPERLYSEPSTLGFSLEAFAGYLDFGRLQVQRLRDGSYAGSCASTAAVLIYGPWDDVAARWLMWIYNRGCSGRRGMMPSQFGIDNFEVSWAIRYLRGGGFGVARACSPALMSKLAGWLRKSMGSRGAGWCAAASTMPDADDTALAIAALRHFGERPAIAPLWQFELPTHFLCFHGERSPSASTNAHVLYTLLQLPSSERSEVQSRIDKTTSFLLQQARPDGYWRDKWHASPLYATSCAVVALSGATSPLTNAVLGRALRWTLDAQHAQTGGWGTLGDATAEETAYALMILFCMQDHIAVEPENRMSDALRRGLTYLRQHAEPPKGPLAMRPSLWIGKDLYTPCRVVEAAILAMLRRGIDVPSTTNDEGVTP